MEAKKWHYEYSGRVLGSHLKGDRPLPHLTFLNPCESLAVRASLDPLQLCTLCELCGKFAFSYLG